MKMLGTLIVGTLFAVLVATPVSAQQPAASQDAHHPPAQAGTLATPPSAGPGMRADAMPMMDMCRQMMMGGTAGMPMMGGMAGMPMMGGATAADPKARAEMMQMHGEMMKAMGEIMMKHARHMQGMKSE